VQRRGEVLPAASGAGRPRAAEFGADRQEGVFLEAGTDNGERRKVRWGGFRDRVSRRSCLGFHGGSRTCQGQRHYY